MSPSVIGTWITLVPSLPALYHLAANLANRIPAGLPSSRFTFTHSLAAHFITSVLAFLGRPFSTSSIFSTVAACCAVACFSSGVARMVSITTSKGRLFFSPGINMPPVLAGCSSAVSSSVISWAAAAGASSGASASSVVSVCPLNIPARVSRSSTGILLMASMFSRRSSSKPLRTTSSATSSGVCSGSTASGCSSVSGDVSGCSSVSGSTAGCSSGAGCSAVSACGSSSATACKAASSLIFIPSRFICRANSSSASVSSVLGLNSIPALPWLK